MARTPHLRHLRHGQFDRVRRSETKTDFLAERADTLDATGVAKTFTAAITAAAGTLTLAANANAAETVTIDSKTYTFRAALTEHVAIAATGTLTLATNVADGDTVTIGTTAYTFQTVLVNSARNVLIGLTASDSLDNLIAAIGAGAGSGTLYGAGTVAHTTVNAAAGAGDTAVLTAKTAGTAGNAIATTETSTHASFGAVTLTGGAAIVAPVVNEILIGGTASDTLDNLIAAVNKASGEGTTYSTGTVASTVVTAAAGAGDTMVVTAVVGGTAPNSYATTETMTSGSWGHTTLTGGTATSSLASTAHGQLAGAGPYVLTTSDTLPAGLLESQFYWVLSKTTDALVLSTKRGGPAAEYTDNGVGTHTLTKDASEEAIFEALRNDGAVVVAAATDVDAI